MKLVLNALILLALLPACSHVARKVSVKKEEVSSTAVVISATDEALEEPSGIWETEGPEKFTIRFGEGLGQAPKAVVEFKSAKKNCSASIDAEFNPSYSPNTYTFVRPRHSKPPTKALNDCQAKVAAFVNRGGASLVSETQMTYIMRVPQVGSVKTNFVDVLDIHKLK